MPIRLPVIPEKISFLILRGLMGIIFISHGIARLYYDSVADFGGFLNSRGLVIGVTIAWVITIGEIVSGLLLTGGYWVRYLVVFHFVVITGGIIMVHRSNGWFTVGHGQGGVEYSLLILAVLVLLYSKEGNRIN